MGVIQRQSIKRSAVSYLGVVIGLASTLFIYPSASRIYGHLQFIIGMAVLLSPLLTLGTRTLSVYFYPSFKSDNTDNGFYSFLVLSTLGIFTIMAGLLTLGRHWVYQALSLLELDQNVFAENLLTIGILTLLYSLIDLHTVHASNYQRITIPEALNNLTLKIGMPLLVLLFEHDWLTQAQADHGLLLLYNAILLGFIYYLYTLGQRFRKINRTAFPPERLRAMASYALFGMLGILSSSLAFRLDIVMVTTLLGESTTGLYTICIFITNTILIPYGAVVAITAPFISQYWAAGDTQNIAELYQRTSLNLASVGLFLSLALFLVLDDLFRISSNYEALQLFKPVVYILASGRLFDMIAGINTQIITFSGYYRFNMYIVLFLGLSNILLNYFLIPIYGATGAAVATFISLIFYNLIKVGFIYHKYQMLPFSPSLFKVIGAGLLLFTLFYFLPRTSIPLLNLALFGGLFTLSYWIILLRFRLAPDIINMLPPFIKRYI